MVSLLNYDNVYYPKFMRKVNPKSFLDFSELKANVKTLEEWLKEVEMVLKQPLKFSQKWTQEAIREKMQELKVRFTK